MIKLTQQQIAHVQALENSNRGIDAKIVVADARKKSSPIHSLFDWDKGRCAERDLERQARVVIGAVQMIVTNTVTSMKVPVYVKDPDVRSGYRAVTALAASPDSARESLIYTLEVASGHLRRALMLAEPLGMQGEIDALLDRIVGVQRLLKKAA